MAAPGVEVLAAAGAYPWRAEQWAGATGLVQDRVHPDVPLARGQTYSEQDAAAIVTAVNTYAIRDRTLRDVGRLLVTATFTLGDANKLGLVPEIAQALAAIRAALKDAA